ncbi:unnamed protein product, partial [Effrenium voratum]
MVDFAGYAMPVQYEAKGSKHALSIIDSTKWTRESASLFDVSHMCSIRWTGKDAFDFVERVTTADVYGLPPMTGSLSVITNERGGVIDDTLVTKCNSKEHGEHVYQVVNAGCAPKDLKHFEEELGKFGGDVKMEVMWDNRGLFALQGPKAMEVLERISSTNLKSVPFGQCLWMTLEGAECLVARCGYTGEDGFEVFVPGDAAVPVWRLFTAQPEVRLAGLGARDSLRLEAGLCLYGHELDEDTSPCEAGLSWVVPKARREGAKNKFIGSDEILAQLADKSRYKRLRAGLMPASGPPAREGADIETMDGQPVGKVTSGSMSPCLKKNISIGYINKPHNKQGTDLQVVVRGKRYPAKASKRLDAARALNAQLSSSPDGELLLADFLRRDDDWQVRVTAAKALGALSGSAHAQRLLAALVAALGDVNSFVREAAAEALGHFADSARPEHSAALEAILRYDRASGARSAAARAIGKLAACGRDYRSSASLAAALEDEAWQVRWSAAAALAALGHCAEPQVPALASVLGKDPAWLVRHAAAAALGRLGGRAALEEALRSDPDPRVREESARSLARLGQSEGAESCAYALAAALKDADAKVRAAAIAGLGSQASAREHAGDLVEQLLTGDDDISGAVGRFFQDATSGAATALVAAAFGPAQEAVRELHEISEWAAAIAQKVWRLAADLKSPQASVSAERYLTLLGPAAGICLASEVIKAKAVDFAPRMATIRGLISCFTRPLDKAQLPDLACAALSEWIYEPSVETLPVPGLELVKLQRPEEHHGINLQWALLRDQWGSCFLVFRGSETVLDWTENSYMSLRRVNVPSWQGVLLLHSGFWSTAEAESECLRQAIVEAAAGVPFEELILCGGSKGGANALAAAIQWSLPLTGRAWLDDLPCRELVVVTFGAPNIAGRGSGQPETTRALEELQAALHKRAPRSRAWRFIEDPVPALMSARSQQVLGQYYKGASGLALGAMRRFMPNAYKKGHKYLQEAMRVTATFQAVLPEALLDPPPDVSRGEFDASVHPQRNYTE